MVSVYQAVNKDYGMGVAHIMNPELEKIIIPLIIRNRKV